MKFQTLRSKFFRSPHIPNAVIYLILLLVFTQFSVLLMNQPTSYWQNPGYAEPYLMLDFLLGSGPGYFGAGAFLYLIVMGLLMKKMNEQAGLFLSCLLLFFHSLVFYRAAPCGLSPIFEWPTNTGAYIFRYGLPVIVFVLYFCLILIKMPDRWAKMIHRGAQVVSIGWLFILGIGLIRAIRPPDSPWSAITPDHSPGKLVYSAVAYDTKRQRAVLFGGVSQWRSNGTVYEISTWEWNGKDWHEMTPLISPPGRIQHAMVYDEARGEIILFGGENEHGIFHDIWAWNGENWRQLCPECNPPKRSSPKLFYSPEREEVLLYGGFDEKEIFGEIWAWNGTGWNYFPVSTSAPGVATCPLIYDEANQRVVTYIDDVNWGGTWFLEGDAWRHLPLLVQPEYRRHAMMVYEPVHQKSIFFGGEFYGTWYKDTWVFDGDTWIELQTPFSPSHRSGGVAFFDPVRKSMILYGGQNEDMILKDMWELTLPEGDQ